MYIIHANRISIYVFTVTDIYLALNCFLIFGNKTLLLYVPIQGIFALEEPYIINS